MGRRNKSSGKSFVIRGKAQLSASLTATSAGGAFVATRFEVDTTLCTSWTQLGQSFTKWKLKSLTFHFATLKGSTIEGTVGICFLTDPMQTTPNTASSAMNMQYSKLANVHQNISLRVKPANKWYFTRDIAANTDDRLEMPGDVVFFTENTTAAYVPGLPWVSYVVEFASITNATVSPLFKTVEERQLSLANPKSGQTDKTRDNESSCVNTSVGTESKQEDLTDPLAILEFQISQLSRKLSEMKSLQLS